MKFEDSERKRGAPEKYKPEYCQELIDYFQAPLDKAATAGTRIDDEGREYEFQPVVLPATFAGFAAAHDVWRDILQRWAESHPDFDDAMKKAKELQEQLTTQMGASGGFKTAFAIFMMKNTAGWRDKHDVDVNSRVQIIIDEQDAKS